MNELVLFLDFDGVFHHVFPVKDNTDSQNEMFHYVDYVERFCLKIKENYALKIVFATSWKEKFSFEDLKGFFEDYPSIYEACHSTTPNIKNLKDEGYKWNEADEWLKANNYTGQYIIFDDYAEVWKINGKENPNLILCEDKFDNKELSKALSFLNIRETKPKLR